MKWKRILLVVIQIVFINLFFMLGNLLVKIIGINFPGSIVGMGILLIALYSNLVKLEWVEEGAKWLLAELLLFFIPSAVGLVQYPELIGWSGVGILVVIFISTIAVMVLTGWIADWFIKREKKEGYRNGTNSTSSDDHLSLSH